MSNQTTQNETPTSQTTQNDATPQSENSSNTPNQTPNQERKAIQFPVSNSETSEKSTMEGQLQKQGTKGISWKDRYFILTEGSLHYYKNQFDQTPAETIDLKNYTLEPSYTAVKKKNSFALKPKSENSKIIILKAKNEEKQKQWVGHLQEALNKDTRPPPKRDLAKKKSFSFNASKSLTEIAVNTALGKKIIQEYTPENTFVVIKTIKSFIAQAYGKPKAKQVEKDIYKLSVDVATLYKEKFIKTDDFTQSRRCVLRLWSTFLDFCEMKFIKDVALLSKLVNNIQEAFEILLKPHLTPTSWDRMRDLFAFISDEKTLDTIFNDEYDTIRDEAAAALRSMWETELSIDEKKMIQEEKVDILQTEKFTDYSHPGSYMV